MKTIDDSDLATITGGTTVPPTGPRLPFPDPLGGPRWPSPLPKPWPSPSPLPFPSPRPRPWETNNATAQS